MTTATTENFFSFLKQQIQPQSGGFSSVEKYFLTVRLAFAGRSARKRERSAQRLFYLPSAVCINMGFVRIRACGVVV